MALAFAMGGLMGTLFGVLLVDLYRQTLLRCARQGTPEKLPDGNFYYVVREDNYIADLVGEPRVARA